MASERDEDVCPLQVLGPTMASSESSTSASRASPTESIQSQSEEENDVSTATRD